MQNVYSTDNTRRFLSTETRHKNTDSKIGPRGQETRPKTKGKRPKTSKTDRNSRTLPWPNGFLYQRPYRTQNLTYFRLVLHRCSVATVAPHPQLPTGGAAAKIGSKTERSKTGYPVKRSTSSGPEIRLPGVTSAGSS